MDVNKQSDSVSEKIFFIRTERHDKDRIEFQLGFDGRLEQESSFQYDVDLVLFFPKSWGVADIDPRELLTQDMQSYVRLHTQASNPKDIASYDRIQNRLNTLKTNPNLNNARSFATDFFSFLSAESTRSAKLLKKQDTDFQEIIDRTFRDYRLLRQFRDLLQHRQLTPQYFGQSHDPSTTDLSTFSDLDRDLLYINQYISHLYIQGVGLLLELTKKDPQAEQLSYLIEELIQEEFQVRRLFHMHLEPVSNQTPEETSQDENDSYLFQIALLKKYFQKDLFLKSERENLENRLIYPVYALAAAIAASWALIIQQWITINYLVSAKQLLPTAIVVTAIFAYIVKDILKDFIRRRLLKAGFRWLPYFERKLSMNTNNHKKIVGVIKEYVRIFNTSKLPQGLLSVRYSQELSNLEKEVDEDIVHFRKTVELNLKLINENDEYPWGLREIIRLRLNRMQNSTDDAYKSIHFLNSEGQLIKKATHRTYHVHACAWIRRHPPRWTTLKRLFSKSVAADKHWVAFKAFRISLDKNDILSCRNLRWKKKQGIPPLPR